jgi:hypothetical protein
MSEQTNTPQISALLELTQGLLYRYGELASNLAEHLPESVKAELVDHTQTVIQEARDRITEIALMASTPPVDEYRLSTCTPVVGGGS